MASNHWPIFSPLQTYGVGLFLHQQGLDTTTSAGKAMLLGFSPSSSGGSFENELMPGLLAHGLTA